MKYVITCLKLASLMPLLALGVGCANTGQTENLLSAAGFRTLIATTAQQQLDIFFIGA